MGWVTSARKPYCCLVSFLNRWRRREEEFLKGLGIDIQTETRTIVSFSAGGREIGEIEE